MKKALKFISVLVGLIVLLCAIAIMGITMLVNPNDFKGKISEAVHDATGLQLTFNGNIRWSFFPWVGVQINQVQLSNAPGFGNQPFAQIKQVYVRVELVPLFKHQVNVSNILVDGLELHLIKNANGVANWESLDKKLSTSTSTSSSKSKNTATTTNTSTSTTTSAHPMTWAIAGVDIKDGHVTWVDQQKKQSYDVSDIQLNSHAVKLDQPFPVSLHFVLQSTQPAVKMNVQLNSTVTAGPNDQFNAQGKMNIDNLQASTTQLNDIAVQFIINNSKTLTANGDVKIASAQLSKFKINNIAAQYSYQNNIAKLTQISAKLYQGDYNGNLTYVMGGKTPLITTDAHLSGVQIENLFHDLTTMTRLQLAGTGEVNTHLTTTGTTSDAMLAHLSGTLQMNISNGSVKGVDIPHLISMGKSLLNKEAPSLQGGTNQTDFSKLSASALINNGIANNNDLLLQSQYLQATGKGSVDMVKKNINYQLTAQPVHPDSGKPDGMAIPITITGSFDNLSIRPDLDVLVKSTVQQQIDKQKDLIKSRINVEIGKRLNKQLGDQLKNQLDSFLK